MKQKLGTMRWRATYEKRKHIAEPAFGWIKAAQGFRQFLLRGIDKVRAEWDLVCSAPTCGGWQRESKGRSASRAAGLER